MVKGRCILRRTDRPKHTLTNRQSATGFRRVKDNLKIKSPIDRNRLTWSLEPPKARCSCVRVRCTTVRRSLHYLGYFGAMDRAFVRASWAGSASFGHGARSRRAPAWCTPPIGHAHHVWLREAKPMPCARASSPPGTITTRGATSPIMTR